MQNCPFNCFFINIYIYSMGFVSIKNIYLLTVRCILWCLTFICSVILSCFSLASPETYDSSFILKLIIGFSLMIVYLLLLFILCIPFMGIKNVWQKTNLDILTLLMAIIINALIY